MNERERSALVGYRESELVVVDETNFFDLGSVIDVVEKNRVTQDFGFLRRSHLNRVGTNLAGKKRGTPLKFEGAGSSTLGSPFINRSKFFPNSK